MDEPMTEPLDQPSMTEEGAHVTGPEPAPRPEPRAMTDDLHALLAALPPEIVAALEGLPPERDLIEVVMDLGRRPEARFGGGGEAVLLEREVVEADLQYVVDHIGTLSLIHI